MNDTHLSSTSFGLSQTTSGSSVLTISYDRKLWNGVSTMSRKKRIESDEAKSLEPFPRPGLQPAIFCLRKGTSKAWAHGSGGADIHLILEVESGTSADFRKRKVLGSLREAAFYPVTTCLEPIRPVPVPVATSHSTVSALSQSLTPKDVMGCQL